MILALANWVRTHRGHTVVIGVVAIALVAGVCRGGGNPAIPPRDQASIDWLASTRPSFLARIDTFYQREVHYVAVSDHKATVADSTRAHTDSLRQRASELEAVAVALADTSSAWRVAALAWHQTADSLTVETDTLRAARDAEKAARLQADARAAAEHTRRDSSEDLNRRLANDVKAAHGGILRRLTARVGVSAGYGVVIANDGTVRHGPALQFGLKVWP
jgi:hypothetical protein